MKLNKIFIVLLIAFLSPTTFAKASHSVKGHVKKDGTYVAPHRTTNPDKTQKNNYSTKGNVNPYTRKKGTKEAKK